MPRRLEGGVLLQGKAVRAPVALDARIEGRT